MVNLLKKYKKIIVFGIISIFVTIIDIIITYIFKSFFSLVVANSVGVISGAIVQYLLNSKLVFHVEEKKSKNLLIYICTFVFGLIIANLIIYYSNEVLVSYFASEKICFLISKSLSIIIPFFGLYIIRKKLYEKFN